MTFQDVLGYEHIKKYLQKTIHEKRIAHTQLFVGEQGTGVLQMAIAYATEIISSSGNPSSKNKCKTFTHPDMHFVFPTATTSKVKKDPVSSLFMQEWRDFITEQPYGTLFDWYQFIGVENKQGIIGVNESKEIYQKLILQSFEGGYKVMIIWGVDCMNTECANKLLKLLEEPPADTIFILVAQNDLDILPTILSRCQITRFPKLGEKIIKEQLIKEGLSESEATSVAFRSQGIYKKALDFVKDISAEKQFEQWFIHWVRTAYSARGNKASVLGLIKWSEEIASQGRETQKQFLNYCLEIFRQAILWNYGAEELVYSRFETPSFKMEKFAPFVHHANICEIQSELEKAIFHIDRNANAKVTLTDLSIKLTRLLHTSK